jgi:2-dehydro-3-deoxygluconokinase
MKYMRKFAAIGEAMIELSHQSDNQLNMSFAGDTINVITYLTRYKQYTQVQTYYATALGVDPYSNMMIQQWQQENINTELVFQLPNKLPGLYLIRTDQQGERTLYFYRSQSAARELFKYEHAKTLCQRLINMDYLYFSMITLAILDEASRMQLFDVLTEAKKNGATIIFDSNYRPALWPDLATAQNIYQNAARLVDIALPTFDDEQKLFNEKSVQSCAERLHKLGVQEIVIKQGDNPCYISTSKEQIEVPAEKVAKIVDTTSAGDSFNAGYLAARMQNIAPEQAARYGHRLASTVITYPGAIIPLDKTPALF